MSSTKQKTGGSAKGGPGLKSGTGSSVSHRKPASLGKTGNVSPNSANRGKQSF